jgi:hypothetical protein
MMLFLEAVIKNENYILLFSCCIVLVFLAVGWTRDGQASDSSASQVDIVSQLNKNVPDDFPRFTFVNHPEQAQLLSHFLWYHFHHRLGNSTVLFNKEYLLTADIWLGNAYPRGSKEKIQDVHRRVLLDMYIDN